jgi:DNA-directed RNA polymerase specialized sigma24 family protein
VRFGGDLELAPEQVQVPLAAHLAGCGDCASYVSQIATTRDLLGRCSDRGGVQSQSGESAESLAAESGTEGADALRSALLARAELLDPANAEDLAQRSLEVGLALQHRDSRPRGVAELIKIMHTLSGAQMRLDGRTTPAVDATATARARADSLEDLDGDADEPALFYPDLYPGDDGLDVWVDSPNQWRGGAQILGPEEVDETGEVYDVLDRALDELPEPLGDLLALVDLQGYPLAGSAQSLRLDELSATAALARARNHVRGRLAEYLTGADSTTQGVPGEPRGVDATPALTGAGYGEHESGCEGDRGVAGLTEALPTTSGTKGRRRGETPRRRG